MSKKKADLMMFFGMYMFVIRYEPGYSYRYCRPLFDTAWDSRCSGETTGTCSSFPEPQQYPLPFHSD
jgi:hypothetical protein